MAATKDPVDLNQVTAFVRVMEAGSFTAAARTLGLPKSSVSRRVSALERSLRLRLLQRGTRKLMLTEAGRLYFEQARAALGRLADANAAVMDMSQEVASPIRFTAGADNTGLVDTPQLINVSLTAPYLHDGSARTLEEIWTVFNPEDKHGRTNDLTKDELNDLIEYLRTR